MTEQIQTPVEDVTTVEKTYIPPMGNSEFALICLGKAWNVVTDGIINLLEVTDEKKKQQLLAWLQPLRRSHLSTIEHTSEFIDNFEHHVLRERNLDHVVEFLLTDLMIGIKNNYTGLPREHIAERKPETDKDPNWNYGPLPKARIFAGERIPVKVQTNQQTFYGYYECLVHQVANPTVPGKIINIQTTVPTIRLKKEQVAPNSAWRWQEISEARLKDHWLKGEDKAWSVPEKHQPPKANPIDTAPTTEGTENVTETAESGSM